MDQDTLNHLAALAKLQLSSDEMDHFTHSINDILTFIQPLQHIDTAQVVPLVHPIEATQPLRDDVPTAKDWRQEAMSLAAASEQNHFLVPQVID